jgi:hypothetical protein
MSSDNDGLIPAAPSPDAQTGGHLTFFLTLQFAQLTWYLIGLSFPFFIPPLFCISSTSPLPFSIYSSVSHPSAASWSVFRGSLSLAKKVHFLTQLSLIRSSPQN